LRGCRLLKNPVSLRRRWRANQLRKSFRRARQSMGRRQKAHPRCESPIPAASLKSSTIRELPRPAGVAKSPIHQEAASGLSSFAGVTYDLSANVHKTTQCRSPDGSEDFVASQMTFGSHKHAVSTDSTLADVPTHRIRPGFGRRSENISGKNLHTGKMTCQKCRIQMKELKGHIYHKKRKWKCTSCGRVRMQAQTLQKSVHGKHGM
jgi:hypothetical protein